jgi:hypothetical protein
MRTRHTGPGFANNNRCTRGVQCTHVRGNTVQSKGEVHTAWGQGREGPTYIRHPQACEALGEVHTQVLPDLAPNGVEQGAGNVVYHCSEGALGSGQGWGGVVGQRSIENRVNNRAQHHRNCIVDGVWAAGCVCVGGGGAHGSSRPAQSCGRVTRCFFQPAQGCALGMQLHPARRSQQCAAAAVRTPW